MRKTDRAPREIYHQVRYHFNQNSTKTRCPNIPNTIILDQVCSNISRHSHTQDMQLFGVDLGVTGRDCCILTSICIGLVLITILKPSTCPPSAAMMPDKGKGGDVEGKEVNVDDVEVSVSLVNTQKTPTHTFFSFLNYHYPPLKFKHKDCYYNNTTPLHVRMQTKSLIDIQWQQYYHISIKTLVHGLIIHHR